jgi:hypothetical protein
MPQDREISWRASTSNVTADNSWRIRTDGSGILNFESGASNVVGMTMYNYSQTYGYNFMWLPGSIFVDYGGNTEGEYPLDVYTGSTQKYAITGTGSMMQLNRTTTPANPPANFGYWYTKNGIPYFKYGSTEYNLTSSGSGVTTFLGLSDTPSTFTANKWVKVNSAGTALEWVDAPGGSTQWNNGAYGINYTAGNVGIGGADQSSVKLYVAGVSGYAAYLSNTNSGSGMGMFVRSDVNNENYPNTILNYGGVYNMFVFQNNGHMAQREVLGAVPTAPTNYGYWYVSGGKPYFKYGSTAYDLTAGTGGGPDLTVQSLSGTSVTWNVTNGVNAKITISGNTTITMSNLSAGSSGNLTVTNPSTPYTLTFSGYTFKVSPYVYRAANSPYLSGGSKLDVFSWYYDGTTVFINGTQDYK